MKEKGQEYCRSGSQAQGKILGPRAFYVWLIFTRSNTPLEICRWFPKFVFTLLTRVRPIKVRILNRFLRVADHRLLVVLIKKELKKIIFRVLFLLFKIVFSWGFEMIII